MTARVVDLPRVAAALRALDVLVVEHPELLEGDAPERLDVLVVEHPELLEGDAPERLDVLVVEHPELLEGDLPGEAEERDEHTARAEGRYERPGKP